MKLVARESREGNESRRDGGAEVQTGLCLREESIMAMAM